MGQRWSRARRLILVPPNSPIDKRGNPYLGEQAFPVQSQTVLALHLSSFTSEPAFENVCTQLTSRTDRVYKQFSIRRPCATSDRLTSSRSFYVHLHKYRRALNTSQRAKHRVNVALIALTNAFEGGRGHRRHK